ncbi:unnamed protein product, partial [Vitis vinifera]
MGFEEWPKWDCMIILPLPMMKSHLRSTRPPDFLSVWTHARYEQLQLRLQQEKSMRTMLERAMGRASSTLSPGHRHFAAETKELIAEIELLEEEVANREQHVLTLYRSIFEQCISRPPSEQSSSMASPAHTKNESRKHPSIISSAFCSSKKFPLGPFQVLTSMNDTEKKNLNKNETITALETCWLPWRKKKPSCPRRPYVHEKLPTMDRSMLRTLKDHLYQCPSKLSEEMVRCMAAVYCWLRGAASVNPEKNRSLLLSRSSTNVILPRRGIEEDREWSCKSMVEISWISTDKSQFSRASYAINNYRVLIEQLEKVNVSQMESNAQTAFWVNVYNSLVMHAYLAYGIPHSSLRRLALFHKPWSNKHCYRQQRLIIRGCLQHWRVNRKSKCHRAVNILLPYTPNWPVS